MKFLRKFPLLTLFLTVLFFIHTDENVHSQTTENQNYNHTNFHLGSGVSTFGFSVNYGVNRMRKDDAFHFLLDLHLSDKDGFLGSGFAQLGFVYTRAYHLKENIRLGYGGGISLISLSARPGRYSGGFTLFNETEKWLDFRPADNETTTTIGITVEIHAIFRLSEYFSLGLHGTANFNTVRINAGSHVTLRIRFPKPNP